ncbi:hypothetical protein RTG_01459 [Rhodotorula toruloides ATCC 204091]|uniref:tRNA-splicing endonuclease subunit Sen34 n=1 Tax=Rhodotorula toruloides TaxID=5286 RepID=A0A0K3CLB9_RHOTO|nr:hypothetical protein RTG_01459 [Rhodotorula toruloides ATCC 204091]KAK4332842.1 tRNA-splicing endonuclease subunit Sen34 [Rhodotorula toruloides]PRQ73796.1 hypothetical protein AAT19DRAFT_15363 [Rhodotorula toruloides]
MAAEDPIRLLVSNQRAYLWDLNDIQRLRVQHHVVGQLHGTLPQVTQQNVFLGLPLVLLPEEVVLLVRNNLAVLVDDRAAHHPPTAAQSASYHASRAAAIKSQQEASYAAEQERKREMEALHRDKIEKKRREKEELRRKREEEAQAKRREEGGEAEERLEIFVPDLKEGAANTGPPAAATSSTSPHPPVSAPSPSAVDSQKPDTSNVPYTIIIEPRSSSFPWYDPTSPSVTYASLDAAKDAGLWNYPETVLQESRCRVFEDLWRKGYYMGGGLRFGGDFLVYPGDQLRYHSHFTLTVLSTPSTTIMPLDIVAYGRLATAVKKAHLLASWDADKKQVVYASLEWAAFG